MACSADREYGALGRKIKPNQAVRSFADQLFPCLPFLWYLNPLRISMRLGIVFWGRFQDYTTYPDKARVCMTKTYYLPQLRVITPSFVFMDIDIDPLLL